MKIKNINKIVIIFSIIFILISIIIIYFFIPMNLVFIDNNNQTIQLTPTEQSFFQGSGVLPTKVFATFLMSTQKMQDAKKYGVYVVNANKIKSTSKTTCFRYNFSTKTPCYYYQCPSSYLGYSFYKMNSQFQCSYIKYPKSYS